MHCTCRVLAILALALGITFSCCGGASAVRSSRSRRPYRRAEGPLKAKAVAAETAVLIRVVGHKKEKEHRRHHADEPH